MARTATKTKTKSTRGRKAGGRNSPRSSTLNRITMRADEAKHKAKMAKIRSRKYKAAGNAEKAAKATERMNKHLAAAKVHLDGAKSYAKELAAHKKSTKAATKVKAPAKTRGRKPGSTDRDKAHLESARKRLKNHAKKDPYAHMLHNGGKTSANSLREYAGVKKLGRKKKSVATSTSVKRGRKPGQLNKKTMEKNWASFVSSQHTPKKRGRKPGAVATATSHTVNKTQLSLVKKGRGRPKGVKDSKPRAKRGSRVASTNVKAIVHRTPTKRIGVIKSSPVKRGKLR